MTRKSIELDEKDRKVKQKVDWRPATMCNSGAYVKGAYKVKSGGRTVPAYGVWVNMMSRCYNPDDKDYKNYGDDGATVNILWHEYQDFAKDYNEMYPLEVVNGRIVDKLDSNGKRWHLDKDIKVPGNNEYGPDTCILITNRLNNLFNASGAARGRLPLGVSMLGKRFQAGCNDGIEGKSIAENFHCLSDAVDCYWKFKFKVVLSACEEIAEYDEDLGELIIEYFKHFKEEHYPKVVADMEGK